MPDLTEATLARLRANTFPEVELEAGAVAPAYDGLSLLNLPASLVRWLGAAPFNHPGVDLAELDELARDVDQILVILVDALGFDQFVNWVQEIAPQFQPLLDQGLLAPLTSVVPSTTSSALTTLWTGLSPIEHGILGYELYLKEYGLVANMITHNPASIEHGGGLLYQAGMDPENFLPGQTVGERLREAGVESHAFLHASIANSGLSRMHYPKVQRHSFYAFADLWVSVRHLLQSRLETKRLVWVYYGGLDTASHRYGPGSEQAALDFSLLAQSMQASIFAKHHQSDMPATLFLMLSDHGQIKSHPDPFYDLSQHPNLARRLVLPPTGESRLAYLYPRPGQAEAVDEYLHRTWPNQFLNYPSSYLIEKGLFGPGAPHPMAASRLGDRTLVSQGEAYLWWAARENYMHGRHGGLSPAEMLVPLLAYRMES